MADDQKPVNPAEQFREKYNRFRQRDLEASRSPETLSDVYKITRAASANKAEKFIYDSVFGTGLGGILRQSKRYDNRWQGVKEMVAGSLARGFDNYGSIGQLLGNKLRNVGYRNNTTGSDPEAEFEKIYGNFGATVGEFKQIGIVLKQHGAKIDQLQNRLSKIEKLLGDKRDFFAAKAKANIEKGIKELNATQGGIYPGGRKIKPVEPLKFAKKEEPSVFSVEGATAFVKKLALNKGALAIMGTALGIAGIASALRNPQGFKTDGGMQGMPNADLPISKKTIEDYKRSGQYDPRRLANRLVPGTKPEVGSIAQPKDILRHLGAGSVNELKGTSETFEFKGKTYNRKDFTYNEKGETVHTPTGKTSSTVWSETSKYKPEILSKNSWPERAETLKLKEATHKAMDKDIRSLYETTATAHEISILRSNYYEYSRQLSNLRSADHSNYKEICDKLDAVKKEFDQDFAKFKGGSKKVDYTVGPGKFSKNPSVYNHKPGKIGPGQFSKNPSVYTGGTVMKEPPKTTTRTYGTSISVSSDRSQIERETNQFLKFGALPEGFEFLPGRMGRLASAENVATGGAMPLMGMPSGGIGMPSFAGGAVSSTMGFGQSAPGYNTGSASSENYQLSGKLAEDRKARFENEIKDNPALLSRLYNLARTEVGANPKNQQLFLETVFNRAMFSDKSINSIISSIGRGGYYPGIKSFRPSEEEMENFRNSVVGDIMKGSNRTSLATDNASNAPGNPVAQRRIDSGVTGQWLGEGKRNVSQEFYYRGGTGSGRYRTSHGVRAEQYARELEKTEKQQANTQQVNVDVSRVGSVIQKQREVAGIRKGDIDPRLEKILRYASAKTGIGVEVVSGGQRMPGNPGGTGTHEHDHGGAGDVKLTVTDSNGKKRILNPANPADGKLIAEFNTHFAAGGGRSAGSLYGRMGTSIHYGISRRRPQAYSGTDEFKAGFNRGRQQHLEAPIDIDKWLEEQAKKNAVPQQPEQPVEPVQKPVEPSVREPNLETPRERGTTSLKAAGAKNLPIEEMTDADKEDQEQGKAFRENAKASKAAETETRTQRSGGSHSASGSFHSPESRPAEPGSGGMGSFGRCFV